MTLDLIALSVVAFIAIWGAFSGFARQVAQAIAGIAAVAAATPLGRFFAEPMSKALQSSLTVGVVVARKAVTTKFPNARRKLFPPLGINSGTVSRRRLSKKKTPNS